MSTQIRERAEGLCQGSHADVKCFSPGKTKVNDRWVCGIHARAMLRVKGKPKSLTERIATLEKEKAELERKLELILDANTKTGRQLLDHSDALVELEAENRELRTAGDGMKEALSGEKL